MIRLEGKAIERECIRNLTRGALCTNVSLIYRCGGGCWKRSQNSCGGPVAVRYLSGDELYNCYKRRPFTLANNHSYVRKFTFTRMYCALWLALLVATVRAAVCSVLFVLRTGV